MDTIQIINFALSLLAIIISIAVAFSQFKQNRKNQFHSDREELYWKTFYILHIPVRNEDITVAKLMEFKRVVDRSKIIYGDEIHDFLVKIYDKLCEYKCIIENEQLEDFIEKRKEYKLWFGERIAEIDTANKKSKFIKHLDVS